MCTAHSHGARVVIGVDFNTADLGNRSVEDAWIAQQVRGLRLLARHVKVSAPSFTAPHARWARW
jgi:hypothetical protein